MTDADLAELDQFIIDLGAAIKDDTGALVLQEDLEPTLGFIAQIMTAAVLAMQFGLSDHFIAVADKLVNHRRFLTEESAKHCPQQPACPLDRTDYRECERVGRLLAPAVQKRCEAANHGPEVAIVSLLTAAVETAASLGDLATFYDVLRRISDGQRDLMAAAVRLH
jgi:hypothetical protein